MKKFAVSSALSALLVVPGLALEIYSNDDTKVDVYGSIRGYVGTGQPLSNMNTGAYRQSFILGIQDNSQFGVNVKSGKFKAKIELGVSEKGISDLGSGTPYRQFWGSYDTGFGEVLLGKTDSPIINTGFTSNWLNTENGSLGFGAVGTGHRRLQIQYNIAGFSIAAINPLHGSLASNGNNLGAKYTNSVINYGNQQSPKFALAYTMKGSDGKPLFKIAGSYLRYSNFAKNNLQADGTLYTGAANTNNVSNTPVKDAWLVWAGVKPTFGSSYVSFLANYGVNSYLDTLGTGEQSIGVSYGNYKHENVGLSVVGLSGRVAGANLEFGTKLTSDFSFVIGGGYQVATGGTQQTRVTGVFKDKGESFVSTTAYVLLPYSVSANLQVVPTVAYYDSHRKRNGELFKQGRKYSDSIVAAVRVKWDF